MGQLSRDNYFRVFTVDLVIWEEMGLKNGIHSGQVNSEGFGVGGSLACRPAGRLPDWISHSAHNLIILGEYGVFRAFSRLTFMWSLLSNPGQ